MIDPAAWMSQSGQSSSPVQAPDRDGETVRVVQNSRAANSWRSSDLTIRAVDHQRRSDSLFEARPTAESRRYSG